MKGCQEAAFLSAVNFINSLRHHRGTDTAQQLITADANVIFQMHYIVNPFGNHIASPEIIFVDAIHAGHIHIKLSKN